MPFRIDDQCPRHAAIFQGELIIARPCCEWPIIVAICSNQIANKSKNKFLFIMDLKVRILFIPSYALSIGSKLLHNAPPAQSLVLSPSTSFSFPSPYNGKKTLKGRPKREYKHTILYKISDQDKHIF